jgi:hypothetical protein
MSLSGPSFATEQSNGITIAVRIREVFADADARRMRELDRAIRAGHGSTEPRNIPWDNLSGLPEAKPAPKEDARRGGRESRKTAPARRFARRCTCGRPIRKRRDSQPKEVCSICERAYPVNKVCAER